MIFAFSPFGFDVKNVASTLRSIIQQEKLSDETRAGDQSGLRDVEAIRLTLVSIKPFSSLLIQSSLIVVL
jgi:hypothetical protein